MKKDKVELERLAREMTAQQSALEKQLEESRSDDARSHMLQIKQVTGLRHFRWVLLQWMQRSVRYAVQLWNAAMRSDQEEHSKAEVATLRSTVETLEAEETLESPEAPAAADPEPPTLVVVQHAHPSSWRWSSASMQSSPTCCVVRWATTTRISYSGNILHSAEGTEL